MPAEDSEVTEVTPMIVKVPKIPRDGSIDDSALACLLTQSGKELAGRKIRRDEVILDYMKAVGTLGCRHGRSQNGIKTDGNAVDLYLLQWLMDKVHVQMRHGACTAVEVLEVESFGVTRRIYGRPEPEEGQINEGNEVEMTGWSVSDK